MIQWDFNTLGEFITKNYWENPEDAIGDIRKFISLHKDEKTIEQIAEKHCSPDSPGCIIGLIVARNGEFFQSFAFEFGQDITPDGLQTALIDAATQLNVSLKMFDEEGGQDGTNQS